MLTIDRPVGRRWAALPAATGSG